ncbi:protein ROOT HAIR DEFECTIVE 3 isoform X1 [Coffea arabica]|uniref:Protein ROOT HAIR DEFECTIVE 3 isoform X1 n=1 Tax=Coffea arabica TaxID=13443 RepID=A0A6P6WUC2_COFAR|nr:protein ROOT HAIR DEFECTIVE 3-like isoform X2 [Coffea arabica]
MDMERPSKPALLISRNGNFKTDIEQHLNLTTDSSKAAVVSIIGIQSTGKSTLSNCVFKTAFEVMDENKGMAQTTKGIWMTKCPSPSGGSPILVIDTEGSDGCEREEDVTFEKQTALFSLVVSNTVIMNMKCDNVNLHNGGGWSLLRTVFEVMIRKCKTRRKVNLVFVLRDKNGVPLHVLEKQLVDGLKKIWEETFKRQALPKAALEKYFQIKVETLPHYVHQEDAFREEVGRLKDRIMHWTRSGEKIPASGFVGLAQKIWCDIKQEKDLDLPQLRIMVSGVRCEEIADEKYKSFRKDESWTKIKEQVEERTKIEKQVGVSPELELHFGKNVSKIWMKYLSKYDADTQHYHQTKRDEYKRRLTDNLLKEIEPIYQSLVKHMYQATLQMFTEAALKEIEKTHALSTLQAHNFITKFKNQLKDAAIRPANLDYKIKLVAEIKSEMDKSIRSFQAIIEMLKQPKKDRQKFWEKVVKIGAHTLNVAVSATVMALVPGIGTAVGVSPLSASALSIISILMGKNSESSEGHVTAMTSTLKEA